MRIITRPDLDGVVCAVLLRDALKIDTPIVWIEPAQIQKGLFDVQDGDILANLPFDPRASLWFDHHVSNKVAVPFKGSFALAPSAAGLIYRYYKGRFSRNFDELVEQTDIIDSASLTADQILFPELHPYVLVSMTLSREHHTSEDYWNRLVHRFLHTDIDHVLADIEVQKQCASFLEKNAEYRSFLANHTTVHKKVSVTDFRDFPEAPYGNRFLVFSLFPDTVANVKVARSHHRDHIALSVGQSILNRNCQVNIGHLLARFEGGGHPGAGGAMFHTSLADEYLPLIVEILAENNPLR